MPHIGSLFHFDTGCGVGLVATLNIDLSVAHNLLCCGIVVYAGLVKGSGGGFELCHEGHIVVERNGTGVIGNAIAPLHKLISLIGSCFEDRCVISAGRLLGDTDRTHGFILGSNQQEVGRCLDIVGETAPIGSRLIGVLCAAGDVNRIQGSILKGISLYRWRGFCQDSNRGKTRATTESTASNTRYTVGDRDSGKTRATKESSASNTRYTVRDSNRGKTGAISESTVPYSRYAVGDSDRGKTRATTESTASNTRYAVGDSDRGKTRATIESPFSNTRYAVGDSNGGKTRTLIECTITYTRVRTERQ